MGFVDTISYYLNPYQYYYVGFIYGFIFFLILCLIAYYVYKNDFLKFYNDPGTSNIPNSGDTKGDASIMYFKVNWCPHCRTATPLWKAFEKKYNGKIVNGYKCKLKEYDLTDEDDAENKRLTSLYKIEGYPTIKMKKGNDVIDFDAKITTTSLEEFIQNVTSD